MIPTSLENNIIYQTAKLAKVFQDRMQAAFLKSGYKITVEQFTILALLWYQDGINQQEIAEAIDRDKTTVSRVINTMTKQGLVKRQRGSDKRERLIHLTNYGKEIQDKLVRISGDLYLQAIQKIDEQDLKSTLFTVETIIKEFE